MRRMPLRLTAGMIAAACCVAHAARLPAIETTYGEDPVPNTRCYDGFINLGYGIDPIPAKTLAQRWQAWRASRRVAPGANVVHRASDTPARTTNARHFNTASGPSRFGPQPGR
jgi:hypothetical protein